MFLELPGVLDTILSYVTELLKNKNIICNIIQASRWNNILAKFTDKIVLPLIIYFDDFEVCNPLGSHAGVHKVGAVYYMIPRLPPEYVSLLENIFLAQLHYSSDRSKYGNCSVFKFLIEELTTSRDGITVNVSGSQNIFFSVVCIAGDNLGLNSILGFQESFKSGYFCRICRDGRKTTNTQITKNY